MKLVYRMPGVGVPIDESLLTAPAIARIATAAEQSGWDAICFDEHPMPPNYWRLNGDGHDSVDPLVALAAASACTTTLRLFVYAAILPLRSPFLLAKAVATLDLLSEGRVELGLASGYLPEEFAACGVDFQTRGQLFDRYVELMRMAWSGEAVDYEDSAISAVDVCARPRPVQDPHPPLWIGGNSRKAMERVIRHGAGWMPSINPPGRSVSRRTAPLSSPRDLAAKVDRLRAEATRVGRRDPIRIALALNLDGTDTSAVARFVDDCAEYAASGVDWIVVNSRSENIDDAVSLLSLVPKYLRGVSA